MVALPLFMEPLVMSLSVAFTEPTFRRVVVLMVGAILARDHRTVTAMLRAVEPWAPGHFSSYHRIFSRAPCSLWHLGKALATAAMAFIPPGEPILVPADDTTAQHRGKHVYGKGCHHDAIRSSHSHLVWRWGHRWVTLALKVQLPFLSRPIALPVLLALYRTEELDHREHRRHKTPICLARQLLCVLIRWFPQRRFVLLGDGGYASHGMARFCSIHAEHAALVSRFHGNANLYAPAKPSHRRGRPRVKGAKLPSPEWVVAHRRRTRATVLWYGGRTRRVELVSGIGHWYKAGQGLVPIRWVFVHDLSGTHRDEYLYSTDLTLSPARIVSWFTARWPIETTFQEVRAHLGFESPRQHVRNSVLRMAPCLMGLYSLVWLAYAEHARRHPPRLKAPAWYPKREPTFSDALFEVRQSLWAGLIFQRGSYSSAFQELPRPCRKMLLHFLALVA